MGADEAIKMLEWLKEQTLGYALLAISLFFLVFIISKPERAYLVRAAVLRLFVLFSSNARKGVISNDIRGKLLRASTNEELSDVLPKDIKITWVKEEAKETFFSNDQIVIRLSSSENPQKNLALVTCEYVKHGSLKKIKPHIKENLSEASDITLIRKILYAADQHALNYYDEKVFNCKANTNIELKTYLDKFRVIDNSGMFVHVFLNELIRLGNYYYPDSLPASVAQDIEQFIDFLKNLIENLGRPGRVANFTYRCGWFNVTIAFTGRDEVLSEQGEDFYVKKAMQCIEDMGSGTLYLFALGRKRQVAEAIADKVAENDSRVEISKKTFPHKSIKGGYSIAGVCFEMRKRKELADFS